MRNNTRKMVLLSLLIAIAMVLSYFERFIPLPWNIPGMKLGLANIVTLFAIHYFNAKEVTTLVVVRVILVAVIVGSGMSFFYSMAGGLLSLLGMLLLYKFTRNFISIHGISITGAVLHNIGQLTVLAVITKRVTIALSYAPLLIVVGVPTGIFVGVSANFFLQHIKIQGVIRKN